MDLPFPYQKGKLLSEYSTFGIGGPARYFAIATTESEMQAMLRYGFNYGLPTFILGKGSNTLFDDHGFNGLVIQNKIDSLTHKDSIFFAGSGYSFPRLGKNSAQLGWKGLEFASGIPATVGGAIFMNAGAGGDETARSLIEVHYVTEKGDFVCYKKEDLNFGYRHSCFQDLKGAITMGIFELSPSPEAKMHQRELLNYRLKTQPYGEKSAGCAFRNPTGNSAGRLIEECGLKGASIGGALVSSLHANFIVNRGGARASEVLDLMKLIKDRVYTQKAIELQEEIRFIPYV